MTGSNNPLACPVGSSDYILYYAQGRLGNGQPISVHQCLTPAAVQEWNDIQHGNLTEANSTYWWGTLPTSIAPYTGTQTALTTTNGGQSYTHTTYAYSNGTDLGAITSTNYSAGTTPDAVLANTSAFGLPWYLLVLFIGIGLVVLLWVF